MESPETLWNHPDYIFTNRRENRMTQEQLMELLNDMSLDEKINQLFQGNGSFFTEKGIATGPAADQGFSELSVSLCGSILGADGAEKLHGIQERYMENHPHHIPLLFMADVINGFKTIFPIPLAQGAAFDESVAYEGAVIAAKEASAAGLHVTFAPMVDLCRDARWGRVMEGIGEDPYLSSVYAEAMVEGFQGDDPKAPGKLGACVKHFAAYSAPIAGRDYNNVELSERTLRDDYMPAYEAAVKAGALLVMTSFNTLNRIPSSANKWLMRDVLRGEWGFDGVVISDWAAVEEVVFQDLAVDKKEAAKLCMEAGTDIDMMTTCYCDCLKELIESGELPVALLDEAVLRVLELKNKLGLFENPFKDGNPEDEKKYILCEEHRAAARKAAASTFVLLENDGMLPLDKSEKVLFAGPYADEHGIFGSWSFLNDWTSTVTIKQGVEAKGANASFTKGCELLRKGQRILGMDQKYMGTVGKKKVQEEMEAAVEAAKTADKVVLCLGEHRAETGEASSKGDITISKDQIKLLQAVAEVNENVAVVLFCGRPLDLRKVKKYAKAILVVWMPGTEGGNAIADVLYGDAEPTGRLPMSFPYSVGQVPVFYGEFKTGRHFTPEQTENRFQSKYMDIPNAPLYPFGYGKGYTSFDYSEVTIEGDMATPDKVDLQVSVTVTNTGDRAGSEVVQMYIRDDKGSVVRPMRMLKGFMKIYLEPGESTTVLFPITEDALKFHDINMDYVVEPGTFTVYVGGDSTTENSAVFEVMA